MLHGFDVDSLLRTALRVLRALRALRALRVFVAMCIAASGICCIEYLCLSLMLWKLYGQANICEDMIEGRRDE